MPRVGIPLLARITLGVAAAAVCIALSACGGPPPMLSKADLDSGKVPKKHPKMSEVQLQSGCRSCHRERPEGAPAK